MAFKLFKIGEDGFVETSFDNLDNKAFWCSHGERQEVAFVEVMGKVTSCYSVEVHPLKKENPYHPDLLVKLDSTGQSQIGEVKIKNSPLFFGERYGVSPQFALTMDLKDSFNYLKWLRRGVDITIFIWVKWEAHKMESGGRTYEVSPMRGIWVTQFSKLRKFEEGNPPPIHWYNSSFRQSRIFRREEEKEWCDELVSFDRRLSISGGRVKNLTATGFMKVGSETVPTGHSSGSYVFDLKDDSIFDEIFFKID